MVIGEQFYTAYRTTLEPAQQCFRILFDGGAKYASKIVRRH